MDDLSTLMREAVEDVEPTDRRAELRELVAAASKSPAPPLRHHGGLLAAAVVVDRCRRGRAAVRRPRDPAGGPQARRGPQPRAPSGVRALLRRRDPAGTAALTASSAPVRGPETTPAAALSLLQAAPDDPDYDVVLVERVSCSAPRSSTASSRSTSTRPRSRSPLDDLALQQVIYTVQAAAGDVLLPVQFVHDGNPLAEVGRTADERAARPARPSSTSWRWRASATPPSGGWRRAPSAPTAGPARSRATCPGSCEDPTGLWSRDGTAQSYGWEDHLYPWATGQIDVSDLDPGDVHLRGHDRGPVRRRRGRGTDVDTRTVIIK